MLRFVRRLFLAFAIFLALLPVFLWLEHRAPIAYPALTGHFPVGRTTFAWSTVDKKEVLVWIWYPAASSPSNQQVDYLPPAWREALARHSGVLMSRFLTRDPAVVHVHAFADPDVAPEQKNYPVVIIRAGGGALTTDFTALAEDLAGHGYAVVGFDAPYRTSIVVMPDGRVIQRPPENNPETLTSAADQERLADQLVTQWAADARFVLDQLERLNTADSPSRFAGRLDMQRVGIFGHSLGGATALEFCHDDARCKAGIDIDGNPFGSVVKEGVSRPFLFLLSDHGDLSAPEEKEVFGKIKAIYDRAPEGRLLLMIRGTNHFSFSDQILLKSELLVGVMQFLGRGPGARRGLAITSDYVHTFFDVYLKGVPADGLKRLQQLYPEVRAL